MTVLENPFPRLSQLLEASCIPCLWSFSRLWTLVLEDDLPISRSSVTSAKTVLPSKVIDGYALGIKPRASLGNSILPTTHSDIFPQEILHGFSM